MCDIKINPQNQETCRGCLSSDRRLAFVAIADMYCNLLTEDQKLDALSLSHIALCWECRALLRRTQRFRDQVQKAHTILQDSLHLSPAKPTLSSLAFHRKLEYDTVLQENKPNEKPLFNKAPNPIIDHDIIDKVIIPTKYKTTDIKSDPTAENKEEYVESIQDVKKDSNKNNDSKIEHTSSDSDDTEIFEVYDEYSSLPEDLSEIQIENVISLQKVTRSSLPIHLNNDVTLKREGTCTQTNLYRKVKTENAPFIKTPEILKLEIELKKLIATKKAAAEQVKDSQKQSNKNKLIDGSKERKLTPKNNAMNSDIVDKDNVALKHDENETKTRKQKMAELDPDFSLDVDVENYATDDSEEFKRVPKNKTKKSGTDPNIDDDDTTDKRMISRIATHPYKNIDDVVPYFTEIEMSEQDLRIVLEKDDAIVNTSKPINCTICGMMFKRQRTLTNHGYNWHKGKVYNLEPNLKACMLYAYQPPDHTTLRCVKSAKDGAYPGQYIKGRWINPPPVFNLKSAWQCSRCDRMMRQEHILAHFNEFHRGQFRCTADGCEWIEKPIWKKEHLDQHWDAVHQESVCDDCGTTKKTKKLLELHIKSAHAPPKPPKPKRHECPICLKRLSSRYYLQVHHQLMHEAPSEPEELRYCVECDVTFKRIALFHMHFDDKHSGKPKATCEQCGKVLANQNSLQHHVAYVHTGKTEYSCHICGKYFSRKNSLNEHLKAHNNIPRPKTKPCTLCGRMFQSKRALRHHMCTHTGDRPYKCPHCDAAFTQPHSLRAHLAKQHQVDARVRVDGTIVVATTTNETVDKVQG